MDDLAADIDGRPEGLESDFHDVDGPDYAGAKAPWLEQQHLLLARGSAFGAEMGNGVG